MSVILIVSGESCYPYGESCQLYSVYGESCQLVDCVWRVVPVILIVSGES